MRRPWHLALGLLVIHFGGLHASARASARAVTIVDIDLGTNAVSVSGPDLDKASSPGSTLKPIILLTALQLRVITPHTRVACSGTLRIAGRNLTCAHPASLGVLDAEEALAYSCNSFFARVAQQVPPLTLQNGLREYGILAPSRHSAPEQRALLALGLEGVSTTPLQLAHAYAQVARVLQRSNPQTDAVRAGLLGSVTYGMAHAAQTSKLVVGGKTGTAQDPAPMLQHGWFAGIVFASVTAVHPEHVVVIYAPGGNGNDAALAAHEYLQSRHWQ